MSPGTENFGLVATFVRAKRPYRTERRPAARGRLALTREKEPFAIAGQSSTASGEGGIVSA